MNGTRRRTELLVIRWMAASAACFIVSRAVVAVGQFDDVVQTDTGAPLKVVVRRDAAAPEGPDNAGRKRPVETFELFHVLKPDQNSKEKTKNDFYRLASAPGVEYEVGWIRKDDVIEWPHRQALGLRPRTGNWMERRHCFLKVADLP